MSEITGELPPSEAVRLPLVGLTLMAVLAFDLLVVSRLPALRRAVN
jgi:uncharacterized iron-regulated membrane protein